MKLHIPNNIFATLFVLSIKEKNRPEIRVNPSSLIVSELLSNETAVGLIPSLDIIDNRELIISAKFGLAFEGLLSNSYLYYFNKNTEVKKILLRGDISKNEVILSKIFFKERYDLQPEILLDVLLFVN